MRDKLVNNLTELQEEVIGLLQEEAAEIIQELSKVRRTGTNYTRNGGTVSTIQFLNREITDFLILLEVADEVGLFVDYTEESEYLVNKLEKLKEWTNIPHSVIESIKMKFL